MNTAKNLLEKFINISTDITANVDYEPQNKDNWGLKYWNSSLFEDFFDLNIFNYYILFRFDSSINTIASSYIWDEYGAPIV